MQDGVYEALGEEVGGGGGEDVEEEVGEVVAGAWGVGGGVSGDAFGVLHQGCKK